MTEFSLRYRNIVLNIICDEYIAKIISEHFKGHINIEKKVNNPTYTLIISDQITYVSGIYYKMIDKWFDNAILDCYIDNNTRMCYATNFSARSLKYKESLIQYFVANFFNRFLELEGYYGVHSSCVSKNDQGVLFVAGRNSGKTICMLNMLDSGFDLVTNDKIGLNVIDDQSIGYGIAQSISIRLGPEFCSRPENQKYVQMALSRGIKIKDENKLEGNNMILSDNELASINHVNQKIDTDIVCIINPIYDPSIDRIEFQKISPRQTMHLLSDNYMSLVHDTTFFFREILLDNDEIDKHKTLMKLLSIPCYRCSQNEKTKDEFVETVRKLVLK